MRRTILLPILLICLIGLRPGDGLYAAGDNQWVPAEAAAQEGAAETDSGGIQRRNPFAVPVTQPSLPEEPETREIVFDGSHQELPLQMRSIRWEVVPRIKVSGVMEANGRIQVCAEVEHLGMTILRENERVLLMEKAGRGQPSEASTWFLVKRITRNAMTIQLDDGTVIQGKFY